MTLEPKDPGGAHRIAVHDEQDVPVDVDVLATWAARALELLGAPADAALFVSLVGTERIAELKREALGIYRPTDVLSFPMDDPDDPSPGPLVLGDLVICPDVAAKQARALGHALSNELRHLVVHGLLHVFGRDHADPASELAMAREERGLLAAMEPVA